MSVILRLVLMVSGTIAALVVARDGANFELARIWIAVVVIVAVVGIWGGSALYRLWGRSRGG